MLRFFRHPVGLTRTLLAAFAALWFMTALTPCVMAAAAPLPCHDAPCPHCPADGGAPPSQTMLMTNCQTADQPQLSAAPTLDAYAAPALLQRLPVLGALPDSHRQTRYLRAAAIPHPPLILQYAVFLI